MIISSATRKFSDICFATVSTQENPYCICFVEPGTPWSPATERFSPKNYTSSTFENVFRMPPKKPAELSRKIKVSKLVSTVGPNRYV